MSHGPFAILRSNLTAVSAYTAKTLRGMWHNGDIFELPHWVQTSVLLLQSCVTLDKFLNLSVP